MFLRYAISRNWFGWLGALTLPIGRRMLAVWLINVIMAENPRYNTMTEDKEQLQTTPDLSARHCPVCGARITSDATTCLMCGTELSADEETAPSEGETKQRQRFQPTWWMIVILVVVALAILTFSVILGLRLGEGSVPTPELPTFTPTITATPTKTATPTLTPTITLTPTPVDTPTPIPPTEYIVKEGDTLGAIALEFGMSVEEILAYNGMGADDFIVVGQILLFPPPEPTPGPTPTQDPALPTPTPEAMRVYRVQSGDTLSDIAAAFNVSVTALRAANDIPEGSEEIQAGQALVIPLPTPTPVVSTPTPFVEETTVPGALSWPAPALLYPPDGETFVGTEQTIVLQWASVGILDEREYYGVELVLPQADGGFATITNYTRSTAWRVPIDLMPDAENDNRTFSWRVHVARQISGNADSGYKIISPSIRRRSFIWEADE